MDYLNLIIKTLRLNWKFATLIFLIIIALYYICFGNDQNNPNKLNFDLNLAINLGRSNIARTTEFELYPNGPLISFTGTDKGLMDSVKIYDRQNKRYSEGDKLQLGSLSATYGSVAFDLEKDGFVDLIVTRDDGVWYYKNNQEINKPFSATQIIQKQPGLTPYHITIHDFNHDGNPDFYIKQFKDDDLGATDGSAIILRYYQSNEFVDVTQEVGEDIKLETKLQSDVSDSGNYLKVKLPRIIDFAGARVSIIIGKQIYTKYNQLSSEQKRLLTFDLGQNTFIDKVKIRTIYNKDYNFIEPQINTVFEIKHPLQFDQSNNRWKATSSAN